MTIKHPLFTCNLPDNYKKKLTDATGCSAVTPFEFSPFPERFRSEFWFSISKKSDVISDATLDFSSAYAGFTQEGFTTPFVTEEVIIKSYIAIKNTYSEQKQFKISENKIKTYHLETQAIGLFLDNEHMFHILFSYDIANKKEAISTLKDCLDSLEIYGNSELWHQIIEKEKAEDEAFWVAQVEEKRLKERNQRIIEDEKLGKLVPNPNPNLKLEENTWWTSEMAFKNYHFTLQLNLGINNKEEDAVRQIASKLLDHFEINEQKAKQSITDDFLALYNDSWRQTGDTIISDKEFKNRIQLQTVEVDKNKECRFWYSDDAMFGQHSLLVSFYLKDNAQWVEIHTEMFG